MKFNSIIKRKAGILFFAIFILACLMRFFHLSYQSLHIDEAYILTLVRDFGIREIIENAINHDPRPPLYYMLLHYWIKIFGATEAGVRSLSALFGCLTVIPVFMIAKKMFDKKTALLSIFLLAINPFNIYYSQMIKEVALVSFFAITAFLFFLIALEKNKKIHWALYILCSLFSIYLHYAAGFLTISCFIFLFLSRKRYCSAAFKNGILSYIFIFIGYLPGFYFMAHNLLAMSHYYKVVPGILENPSFIQLIKWALYSFSWFIKGEIQCWSIFLSGNRRDLLNIIPLILLAFVFLRPKYWRKVWRNNLNAYIPMVIAITVPILLELIAARLKIIYFHPRHIPYVSFFALILISHAIVNSERIKRVIFIFILFALMIIPCILLNRFPQEDWRNAINWMSKQYSKNDVVGILNPQSKNFFEYYNNFRMDCFPIPYSWSYSTSVKDIIVVDKKNIAAVKNRVLDNCSSKERLWELDRAGDEGKVPGLDPEGLVIKWLDSTYPLVVKRKFPGKYTGIEIRCYNLREQK